MKSEIIEKIEQKTGIKDIVELLGTRLSGSELNSLLLDVFNQNLEGQSPALLLKQYERNRFVHPADADMIDLLRLELQVLESFQKLNFQPIELSPAAQLGSCSVMGPADQKKIVSATRNTEIMADATNSMALHIASLKKSGNNGPFNFCTVHRHTRGQQFKEKGYNAHFKIGCMVSSGKDTGSYQFECDNLLKHFIALDGILTTVFGAKNCRFKLLSREGYDNPGHLLEAAAGFLKKDKRLRQIICDASPSKNNYYKGIQFKMIVEIKGRDIEIADGGFVDWTQQLLQNKKERLLIAGFGFELLYKINKGLLAQ